MATNTTQDGEKAHLQTCENSTTTSSTIPLPVYPSAEQAQKSAASRTLTKSVSLSLSGHSASSKFSVKFVSSPLSGQSVSNYSSDESNEEEKKHLAARKKRDRDETSPDEAKSRAELKCQKEKKRRIDMNKAYEELMSTLVRIDPDMKTDAVLHDMTIKHVSSLSSSLNRMEVISQTAALLESINEENEAQKIQITELKAKLEAITNEVNQIGTLALSTLLSKTNHGAPASQPSANLMQRALLQSACPALPSVHIPLRLPPAIGSLGAQGTNMVPNNDPAQLLQMALARHQPSQALGLSQILNLLPFFRP